METAVQRGAAKLGERPPVSLKIHLLGRFEVWRDDAPIPAQAWRRRRPADLLKVVALAPGRALARDAVIDALWPDKDPASGANNLHRALYDLRQILGDRWVDIGQGEIFLRREAWIDAEAFEAAVSRGGPEARPYAVSLYRGDLCPDDGDPEWLASRRALLRKRFAEAAFPLAREAAQAGDASTAVPLLRRLLAIDPANDEAHRILLRLLAAGGRRADALRQFDACEAALQTSGLELPSEETRAVRDAILRGELGAPPPRSDVDGARRAARRLLGAADPPPLRGRGAITLLLESLIEEGAGALVLLGERGVGKTRLAVEGARIAQSRGTAVLCGIAGIAHGKQPCALFADVFGSVATAAGAAHAFAEALAATGGGRTDEIRRRVFEAARDALSAAAEGRPVCLVLDDLHAADQSSLNLLHYLARQARALRLIVLATCREDEVRAGTPIQMALAHLDFHRLARGIRVPRLALGATREQVEDLLGALPPETLVGQVHRITDGCPFWTEEVVRAYRDAALLPSDPAAAIRARAARLGPRAEDLLAAAAVAGPRFDFERVLPVSGLTGHDAMAVLEACIEAQLLDEDGQGHRFHHSLARDAIHDGLPASRRAALHAALADVLEAEAAPGNAEPEWEAIAWHRREAGQPGPAIRHLVAAGHRAAAHAGLEEARASFGEALVLLDAEGSDRGPQRYEILDALGRVQLGAGELSAAVRSFLAAARVEDASGWHPAPDARARARRFAALALAAAGQLEPALHQIDAARADAGGGDEAAPLLHLAAQLLWHLGRDREAIEAGEACAGAADRAGDPDLVARGRDLAALARAAGAAASIAPAEDAIPPADRRPQDTPPEHPVEVDLVLWERDLLGDATREAIERRIALLGERARARGAPNLLAASLHGHGVAALAAGRLDAAEPALREALGLHRRAGSALGEALALERLGTLLGLRGRLDEGMELLAEGVVVAERALLLRHALVRLHAAEVRNRLAAGAPYAAEEALREASEAAARHGECVVCDAALRPEAVRAALARGRTGEAVAEADQLDEIARQRGGRGLGAIARAVRGRVLASAGRTQEALAALAESRAAFTAAGLRLEAARCARLEVRLRGAAALQDPAVRDLDALVVVDADV